MSGEGSELGGTRLVPLFPLPNVVLFPRAVLPLHIFEERYKQMTADALAGERVVAMALLKKGWEKDYYGRPEIEPVVCVGQIVSWEKLSDGNYNFLLQGWYRARLLKEEPAGRMYRVGRVEALEESPVLEIDLSAERQRLAEMFREELPAMEAVDKQFRQLLTGPVGTADIADLLAFNFLEDVGVKQALLQERDVRRRVGRTVEAMQVARQRLKQIALRQNDRPSMN